MNQARARRAEQIIAAVVAAAGLAGLVVSRHLGFTEAKGSFLIDVPGDYIWGRQLAFNPLGALLMVAVGLAALAATTSRRRTLILAAAALAAGFAFATIADLTRTEPSLGSRGGNVALALALAVALAVVELSLKPQEN